MRLIWMIGIIGACLVGGGYWYARSSGGASVTFRTATVARGDLKASINATGTIEPEEVIDVGAQVAGMIERFGKDPIDEKKTIDYGSRVKEGTVLAQIDATLFQARLDRAKAQLGEAKAMVMQADADIAHAEADVRQTAAKLKQTEREWTRAQALRPTRTVSETEFDVAEANRDVAKATVELAQAALGQSKAARSRIEQGVAAAEADLREAQRNLDYTTIRSPVEGIIIDRRVNVGQTVVASLNAPSLFLIAKDLRRLEVWATVNEADIGQIHSGQPVEFTVDTYPGQVFKGTVAQVRLNATMTQNVVTYTVVIDTQNQDGKLLPYLTAKVQFELEHRSGVLLVPNAALRFRPQPAMISPAFRTDAVASGRRPGEANARRDSGVVWVQDGTFARPIEVKVGATDGMMSEILDGKLSEGTPIIIGTVSTADTTGASSNPFAPKLFSGSKQQ